MYEATGGKVGKETYWEWNEFTELGGLASGDTVRFKKNNDSTSVWDTVDFKWLWRVVPDDIWWS